MGPVISSMQMYVVVLLVTYLSLTKGPPLAEHEYCAVLLHPEEG